MDPGDEVVAGRRPVVELLRAGAAVDRVYVDRAARRTGTVAEIEDRCARRGVPLSRVPRPRLDELAPGINHQGVVAVGGRFRYAPLERLLADPRRGLLFLDGVSDPHNLGSLLRSADAAGFGGVVLPTRRAARVTAAARRVAAGAAEVVPVARVPSLPAALDAARAAGLWVAGLDPAGEEILWSTSLLDPPAALVLGSEGRGLSAGARSRCDGLVRIPGRGRLDSLNVAVAGAVAMFEVARRGPAQESEGRSGLC